MSEELTHYDVLGVDSSTGKDDIKAAYQERLGEVQADITREQGAKKPDADAIDGYRREEARVRSAWQVLSDPYQRGRYDVTVEGGGGALVPAAAGDGDEDGDYEEEVALSPRERARQQRQERAAQARSGPQRQTMLSTERPPTPPSWPPGAVPPPPRARTLAMLVDILVLMVLLVAMQNLTKPITEDAYPKEVQQVETLDKQLDQIEKCIDRRPKQADSEPAACRAKVEGQFSEAGDSLSKPKLEDRKDNLEDKRKDTANKYIPQSLTVTNAAWALLALVYLVPSSALTGRTLGKRFFWVHVIHADGSPLGWGGAIRRYGAIIVAAAVLSSIPVVSVFAFPIILFAVLTWPRHASLQGVQDRVAKTLVVDG